MRVWRESAVPALAGPQLEPLNGGSRGGGDETAQESGAPVIAHTGFPTRPVPRGFRRRQSQGRGARPPPPLQAAVRRASSDRSRPRSPPPAAATPTLSGACTREREFRTQSKHPVGASTGVRTTDHRRQRHRSSADGLCHEYCSFLHFIAPADCTFIAVPAPAGGAWLTGQRGSGEAIRGHGERRRRMGARQTGAKLDSMGGETLGVTFTLPCPPRRWRRDAPSSLGGRERPGNGVQGGSVGDPGVAQAPPLRGLTNGGAAVV